MCDIFQELLAFITETSNKGYEFIHVQKAYFFKDMTDRPRDGEQKLCFKSKDFTKVTKCQTYQ